MGRKDYPFWLVNVIPLGWALQAPTDLSENWLLDSVDIDCQGLFRPRNMTQAISQTIDQTLVSTWR